VQRQHVLALGTLAVSIATVLAVPAYAAPSGPTPTTSPRAAIAVPSPSVALGQSLSQCASVFESAPTSTAPDALRARIATHDAQLQAESGIPVASVVSNLMERQCFSTVQQRSAFEAGVRIAGTSGVGASASTGTPRPAYGSGANNLATLYYDTGCCGPSEDYLTDAACWGSGGPPQWHIVWFNWVGAAMNDNASDVYTRCWNGFHLFDNADFGGTEWSREAGPYPHQARFYVGNDANDRTSSFNVRQCC